MELKNFRDEKGRERGEGKAQICQMGKRKKKGTSVGTPRVAAWPGKKGKVIEGKFPMGERLPRGKKGTLYRGKGLQWGGA